MNNIVRAFVLVLAVSGSAAFAHNSMSSKGLTIAKPASCPAPTCAPGHGADCGWPQ